MTLTEDSAQTEPRTESQAETDTRTLGEIVGDISRDLTTLVRQEMELARSELKEEAARAGKGAGMLGGAGVAGHLALLMGSLALMFLLDLWMPIACAALGVAVLWGIVAAVLAARGKKQLHDATPPMQETKQTLKEDVQWLKARRS